MSDVYENIIKAKNSESYIKYNEYHVNNILGFTKVSRWELMHSNFIAWLLDDENQVVTNHGQLYKLVLMLLNLTKDPINDKARADTKVLQKFIDFKFIESASIRREVYHIDILIEIKTKEKILPIIIENKVDSKENGKNRDQTLVYFKLCEDKYKNKDKYFDPIYVFLVPIYNKTKPKCDKYLIVTYQDLVDYVIEPVKRECRIKETKENISIYLKCLSFQKENEKGDEIMAMSSEEKEILQMFIKENGELIKNVFELVDFDSKTKANINNLVNNAADTTKYSFNGKPNLSKGRLVLEVVNYYVLQHPKCTFTELKNAFPNRLAKSQTKGVLELENKIPDKEKGLNGGTKRYFVSEPITLSTGEKVLVSNQWEIDQMGAFIAHCKKEFDYDIKESN